MLHVLARFHECTTYPGQRMQQKAFDPDAQDVFQMHTSNLHTGKFKMAVYHSIYRIESPAFSTETSYM